MRMTRRILFTTSAIVLLLSFVALARADVQTETWLDDAAAKILDVYDEQSVLVIGELHGTEETPALVASIIKRLADEGPVTLALEIPRQEQLRIDRFLESDGSRDAFTGLLAGEFWQTPANESDGRRSEAMLALLDFIRDARMQGREIAVVALDDVQFYAADSDRRQGMADRISALAQPLASGPVLALLGNFHARVTPFTGLVISDGEPIEPPVPTASRVREVPLTSLNVMACRGAFWACRDGICGPIELPGYCEDRRGARLSKLDPARNGYHFHLMLPIFTPSSPAR